MIFLNIWGDFSDLDLRPVIDRGFLKFFVSDCRHLRPGDGFDVCQDVVAESRPDLLQIAVCIYLQIGTVRRQTSSQSCRNSRRQGTAQMSRPDQNRIRPFLFNKRNDILCEQNLLWMPEGRRFHHIDLVGAPLAEFAAGRHLKGVRREQEAGKAFSACVCNHSAFVQ